MKKSHQTKNPKLERKAIIREANLKAWENSSATLFSNPIYAGDRKEPKRQKPIIHGSNLNREKTERLRKMRLGLEVAEQPAPQTEPVVEQLEPTLEEHLERIRKLKEQSERIKGSQAKITEGFVYVVVNKAWPCWVKVGQTSDYMGRLNTYQTSSPLVDFEMVVIKHVTDSLQAETEILEAARKQFQVRGEWVKCSVAEIQQLMRI